MAVAAERLRRPPPSRTVSVPWRVGDLVATYLANFAGAVLLLIAWWGASTHALTQSQFVWVDVGVAGLVVAGTGNAMWLLTGRRAIGRRTELLLARVPLPTDEEPAAATVTAPIDDTLVASAAMTRYHRADCPLVDGKPVKPARRSTHERAKRRPCGVCRP